MLRVGGVLFNFMYVMFFCVRLNVLVEIFFGIVGRDFLVCVLSKVVIKVCLVLCEILFGLGGFMGILVVIGFR